MQKATIKNDPANPPIYVDSRSEDLFFWSSPKIRDTRSFVTHESDQSHLSLWISDVKIFLIFGLHLTFHKYGSQNFPHLT